jgi:transposase-like protein
MMTFQEFMATFPDEASCSQFLKDRRWPDGVVHCPRCGNDKVYALDALKQPFKWQCHKCAKKGYRFSVLVGTIFENTNVPLETWFKVLYTILQSKKGVSSRQLRRMFFGERSSLHTAWYVGHRLRAGMKDDDFKQLMGIVEVDETAIGGKDKNRHWDKKQHITGMSGKTTVIGAISRKGNVVCQIIENTNAATLNRFVRKAVSDRVSLVATDEHVLRPSESMPWTFNTLHDNKVMDASADHILTGRGNWAIYIMGWIEYLDDLKIPRRTAFCRKYEITKGRFFAVDDPDYEYQE